LFPIWLKFKGGKGVATMLGICVALMWQVGLAFAAVWIGALALTRMSSVGGMAAALTAPIVAFALGRGDLGLMLLGLALILIWKHSENIARLLNGTEPRVGQKSA
jgi:acyl phosphate:glycerol-3-phosphate acyltransferase